jgi:cellulose synthase/poly-beta-1,6-N-acetylglucosamine synthase-like glycosyltransferase
VTGRPSGAVARAGYGWWVNRLHTGLSRGVGVCGAALGVINAYQLVLLAAAALPVRRRPDADTRLRFLVLIPAHDEEAILPRTLEALAAQEYPAELVEVVVVADNCSDGTAAVAREAGIAVLERDDPARPGKGRALGWALSQTRRPFDAVLILDADCLPSPNLLVSSAAWLADGADATQSDNLVSNVGDSPTAALRGAAFSLVSRVRLRGKDRLGLSCGLLGTGMAFSHEVVRTQPWNGETLAEDFDYHLALVDAGRRVRFVPDASVASPMPTTDAASLVQQRRWEAGKLEAVSRWVPRLVRDGLRKGDPARLHAAFDLLVPPQSLLAALNVAGAVAALAAGSPGQRRLAYTNVAAHLLYVVGGLRVAHAPGPAYVALLRAPFLAIRKAGLYGRLAAGDRGSWDKGHR